MGKLEQKRHVLEIYIEPHNSSRIYYWSKTDLSTYFDLRSKLDFKSSLGLFTKQSPDLDHAQTSIWAKNLKIIKRRPEQNLNQNLHLETYWF